MNTLDSARILDAAGIKYESKSKGKHLIILGIFGEIHFYPTTGWWEIDNHFSKGINGLIEFVRGTQDLPAEGLNQ